MEFKHVPVLLDEVINALDIKEDGIYVDCTLGGAGHSSEILKRLSSKGKLIGIDQDINALKAAKDRLEGYDNVIYVHDNFYNIENIMEKVGVDKVDGILMDLGVSSHQLDTAERGFSYMKEAPLDMRMDRDNHISASEVINNYSEEELYRIIRDYGEEKFAKRIANFIVNQRSVKPIETTLELVDIIKRAIPMKFQKNGHPAKKTFQAIRIEVNRELFILDKAVEDSINRLNKDGILAIITFHSLEDRIIKQKFKELENPCTCPREFPICVCEKTSIIKIISKKPIEATDMEREDNSRSKSAKLRVVKKI